MKRQLLALALVAVGMVGCTTQPTEPAATYQMCDEPGCGDNVTFVINNSE